MHISLVAPYFKAGYASLPLRSLLRFLNGVGSNSMLNESSQSALASMSQCLCNLDNPRGSRGTSMLVADPSARQRQRIIRRFMLSFCVSFF